MKFVYQKRDLHADTARENTFLLCNGLGGYCSVSAAYSAPRADQGILIAAVKAPNQRINMVHHLREALTLGSNSSILSSQEYADGTPAEDGLSSLTSFSMEYAPSWEYETPLSGSVPLPEKKTPPQWFTKSSTTQSLTAH